MDVDPPVRVPSPTPLNCAIWAATLGKKHDSLRGGSRDSLFSLARAFRKYYYHSSYYPVLNKFLLSSVRKRQGGMDQLAQR